MHAEGAMEKLANAVSQSLSTTMAASNVPPHLLVGHDILLSLSRLALMMSQLLWLLMGHPAVQVAVQAESASERYQDCCGSFAARNHNATLHMDTIAQ